MKYEIKGYDFQYVEVTLAPGETFKSEPGAMMYMEDGISIDSKFFDNGGDGFFSKLGNAMKKVISGESMVSAYYTNESARERKIAFSADVTGKIIPIELKGKEYFFQGDSYLCSTPDVIIDFAVTKFSTGIFGKEGFVLQKLKSETDNGIVFINAGGTIEKIELKNEKIKIDRGSLVGFSEGIDFSVEMVKGFKNGLFAGEGLMLGILEGTGEVYVQSMPFKRFATRIWHTIEPRVSDLIRQSLH